jgi:26S proteasome subunit RPN7
MSSSSKTKSQQQQASASAESASIFPKADLAQKIHQLTKMSCGTLESDSSNMLTLTKEVQDEILNEWENPYLYLSLQESLSWEGSSVSSSTPKLQDLKTQHEETLVTLETKVQDAKEHAGDMEVLDARLEIARFAAKSCRKETAMDLYQKVLDLPKLSTGKTIDALMECSRVASFYGNVIENASMIERVRKYSN